MNVLFLGGMFSYDKQEELIKNSKGLINFAANEFQWKIIDGLEKNKTNYNVISAPFIGAYPKRYKEFYFKKFQDEELIKYISFINIWGIRNFSRSLNLKTAIRQFAFNKEKNKVIIIYSPHTPFIDAALFAKKIDPTIHICIIIPDLPQYMNLESGKKYLYNFFKKIDIKKFNKQKSKIDSFVLLTEYMKSNLGIKNKPFTIIEGMVYDNFQIDASNISKVKNIVYTGTLNKKFGVMNLISAFKLISDNDLRLIICGDGESKNEIIDAAKTDSRIQYMGQVDINTSKQLQKQATLLINPRQNNEEYTKYSFPSKTMEYLSTGKPVIAYKLDGIPQEYEKHLFYVEDNTIEKLAEKITEVLNLNDEDIEKRKNNTIRFLLENKTNTLMVKKMLQMISNNL